MTSLQLFWVLPIRVEADYLMTHNCARKHHLDTLWSVNVHISSSIGNSEFHFVISQKINVFISSLHFDNEDENTFEGISDRFVILTANSGKHESTNSVYERTLKARPICC